MRPASSPMSSYILENIRWQLPLLLILLVILTNISSSGAQPLSADINIEEGGELWIEGSASMVNYTCNAEELSGNGEIANIEHPEATVQDGNDGVSISIILPVKTLDCGKRAMNKDMYEALKSDSFPEIRYHMLEALLADSVDGETTSEWMNIRTRGIMEIAGVKDTTSFNVRGKILDQHRFKVQGSKNIHMDTFSIKPPSIMFGLIKADKNLMVHFDVTVRIEDDVRQ